MAATVEIDKAGRIVVPKNLRDALHLTPGTKLKVQREGDKLVFEPNVARARLVIENGMPLIFTSEGPEAPALTNEMVNELIEQGRLERERRFLCLDEEFEDGGKRASA
jgi:AbrB family looped-hinge helix DNA binding protein